MHVRWIHRRSTRLLAGLFLIPALALRVMMPPGFMPGTGVGDVPTLQMCHGAGPLPSPTQPIPSDEGPAPDQGPHHDAPCVFAAAGSAAPPPIEALAVAAPQAMDAAPVLAEPTFCQRARHRCQAARAPPAGIRRA